MSLDQGRTDLIAEAVDLTTGELTDLAEEAGLSRSTLYAWTTGLRNPSAKNLDALLEVLECRSERLGELVHALRQTFEETEP